MLLYKLTKKVLTGVHNKVPILIIVWPQNDTYTNLGDVHLSTFAVYSAHAHVMIPHTTLHAKFANIWGFPRMITDYCDTPLL